MKALSIFNIFVFVLNILAALGLLFSYLAWFVNPTDYPILGIAGLAVPMLMGINAAFVLYWLILGKIRMLVSVLCLLAGWWHFNALYQFSPTNPETQNPPQLRVMTYNVRSFHFPGPYKWHNTPPGIARITDSLNPDILCMQEFLPGGNWVPKFKHTYKFISKEKGIALAIYSTYKIVNSGEVPFTNQGGAYGSFIFADINLGDDTIRVINTHLISIRIENKDLQTFTQIENADDEKVKRSAKEIYKRLLKAYTRRGAQVTDIADFIEDSPYPVILCGDFNDTPTSFAYRQLTNTLQDSYLLAGSGIGATHTRFAHYKIPVRIDHILADKRFTPSNWHVIKKEYSDHFPVVVDFEF